MEPRRVLIAAACIALNLSLAKVAALLSLPVYLDSIGTIIAAVLLPWGLALSVGALTSLLGGIVVNPYFAAYVGTQLVIALVAVVCARLGWFQRWLTSLLAGLFIAVAAILASAPVTAVVFGGVTLSGTTAINALLLASGQGIWKSVMAGAAIIESFDKPAASLLAWLILKRLPTDLAPSQTEQAVAQ